MQIKSRDILENKEPAFFNHVSARKGKERLRKTTGVTKKDAIVQFKILNWGEEGEAYHKVM